MKYTAVVSALIVASASAFAPIAQTEVCRDFLVIMLVPLAGCRPAVRCLPQFAPFD